MIDINELRRLAQAATPGPDGVSLNRVKLLQDFQKEANPATVSELLDRIEAAESNALEQARLNGMGSEREAALMAKLEAAERERDALRAEVESWKGLAAQFSKEADKAKTHLAFAKDELNHLRTKVEAMERQEPLWFIDERGVPQRYHKSKADYCKYGGLDLLYALPGAKGE